MSKKSSTFALDFARRTIIAPSGGGQFPRLTGTLPGPLAQLNRVPHYGCGGCRFESCMDHERMSIKASSFCLLGGRLSALDASGRTSFADSYSGCAVHLFLSVSRTRRRQPCSGRRRNSGDNRRGRACHRVSFGAPIG